MSEERARDRRILRRALTAGALVAVVLGGVLAVGLSGAGAVASAAGLWLGLAVGGFVASGWLLLILALDLAARQRPSAARLWWTFAVTMVAIILPFFALAAGSR